MKFIIPSSLTPERLEELLRLHIILREHKIQYFVCEDKDFYGTFKDGVFKVTRFRTFFRNDFSPVCFLKIIPADTGSQLEVFCRPTWFICVFLLLWILGALIALVSSFPSFLFIAAAGAAMWGMYRVSCSSVRNLLRRIVL